MYPGVSNTFDRLTHLSRHAQNTRAINLSGDDNRNPRASNKGSKDVVKEQQSGNRKSNIWSRMFLGS